MANPVRHNTTFLGFEIRVADLVSEKNSAHKKKRTQTLDLRPSSDPIFKKTQRNLSEIKVIPLILDSEIEEIEEVDPLECVIPTSEDVLGPRSQQSIAFINKVGCSFANGLNIIVEKVNYVTVTGTTRNFTSVPLASCGSTPFREIILLNPNTCTVLKKYFDQLKKSILNAQNEIGLPLTTHQVLHMVKKFVRNKLFSSCDKPNLIEKVDQLIAELKSRPYTLCTVHSNFPEVKIPLLSIEEFVLRSLGTCRHHALATCYILDSLTLDENALLEGSTHLMRDTVPRGAHSWTVFIAKPKAHEPPQYWHLDTLWDKLENFALPEGQSKLKDYGDALMRQIQKID